MSSEATSPGPLPLNNAAVARLTPIEDASDEQIEAVLAVNIKGTLYGCQLAAQRLADGGRIINISNSTTGLALPGYGIYDMTVASPTSPTSSPSSQVTAPAGSPAKTSA